MPNEAILGKLPPELEFVRPDTSFLRKTAKGLFGEDKAKGFSLVRGIGQAIGADIRPDMNERQASAKILNKIVYRNPDSIAARDKITLSVDEKILLHDAETVRDFLKKTGQSLAICAGAYDKSQEGSLYGALGSAVATHTLAAIINESSPKILNKQILTRAVTHANNAIAALAPRSSVRVPDNAFALMVRTPNDNEQLDLESVSIGDIVGFRVDTKNKKVNMSSLPYPVTPFGTIVIDVNGSEVNDNSWATEKNSDGVVLLAGIQQREYKGDEMWQEKVEEKLSSGLKVADSLSAAAGKMLHSVDSPAFFIGRSEPVKAQKKEEEKKSFIFTLPNPDTDDMQWQTEQLHDEEKSGEAVSFRYECASKKGDNGREKSEDGVCTHTSVVLPDIHTTIKELPDIPDKKEMKYQALARFLDEVKYMDENGNKYTADSVKKVFERLQSLETDGRFKGIALVTDGMGGEPEGEAFSALVMFGVADRLGRVLSRHDAIGKNMLRVVKECVKNSHNLMTEYRKVINTKKGGATISVAVTDRDGATHWANVGDSRIYLLDENDQAVMLSADTSHVWKNLFHLAPTYMKPADIFTNNYRGTLIIRMPFHEEEDMHGISSGSLWLKPDERIVMCSDGVWEDFCLDKETDPEVYQKNLAFLRSYDDQYTAELKSGVSVDTVLKQIMGSIFTRKNLGVNHEAIQESRNVLQQLFSKKPQQQEHLRLTNDQIMERLMGEKAGKWSRDNVSVAIVEAVGVEK